jgi:hypothetical protein
MASSYTSLLKFNQPGLGDAGWGTAVNSGFTALADIAIAGLETVDVASGNVAMTIDSGVSGTNDARNMVIKIEGTLTVNRSVTVPASTKLYFVQNSTSGAYTVGFSTATGSGVTVPQGKTTPLRSDGTNIVYAFDHLGSLTLDTALAATSGGTGQTVYAVGDLLYASTTTALSKLAAVATGNVLRSGGVGTAPAWGPVALATDVSGTLPIANGGTGQTTAATAFDALKQAATDTYVGAVELATTAEVQAGTDTARAMTPSSFRGGALVQGVAQNTTSGTSIDFAPPSAGIPSWAKRITIMFSGVSTNGTSTLLVQIGDSGGIETTGYESEAWYDNSVGGFETSTAGFIVESTNAASFSTARRFGTMQIVNLSGNNWVSTSNIYLAVHNTVNSGAGGKTLSGVLDRIRLTSSTGTDVFDAGSVNILYE